MSGRNSQSRLQKHTTAAITLPERIARYIRTRPGVSVSIEDAIKGIVNGDPEWASAKAQQSKKQSARSKKLETQLKDEITTRLLRKEFDSFEDIFLKEVGERKFFIALDGELGLDVDLRHDIEVVAKDASIGSTTRKALIDARLGQGQFRVALLKRWQGMCSATGIGITEVLRASHSKPWRNSTNAERLNPFNGLLLAAHLDALFDQGLISFADDGSMLTSTKVSNVDRVKLGLPHALRNPPTDGEKEFLAYHRNLMFQN